jgi:hypothetical protein
MHLHRSDQVGVVRGLACNPMLDHQGLPSGIDVWSFGQKKKHALYPAQLLRGGYCRHSQSVLLDGSRGNHPQFDEILSHNLKLDALSGQGLDRGAGGLALRMERLQGA